MSPQENLDLNLDSTPIIEWLARARKEGELDRDGLRRSLIARLIWQSSYMRPAGIIEAVRMCFGWQGDDLRSTLAKDIWILRKATKSRFRPLVYSTKPNQRGFWFRGRPPLDRAIVEGIIKGASQVDPRRIEILKRKTTAERFAIGCQMTEGFWAGEAFRLRAYNPHLSREESLRLARLRYHESNQSK